MTIFDDPEAALAGAYPGKPARLRHRLAGDPLFSLEALIDLARRLPPAAVEYNAGDLAVDQDPKATPSNGLSVEETIRRIVDCNSWIALKNVERLPGYAAALDRCLREIGGPVRAATGAMAKQQGFIFISSPQSVTPFHFDPEHNILLQLQGVKRMYLYPPDPRLVSDEQHERYHAGDSHRNLRHCPLYDALAIAHDLHPGDALYVPVKAPHWVKNGDAPSISFSITWGSGASLNEARLRLANRRVRLLGGRPPAPGAAPARDGALVLAHRLATKIAHPFG